MTHTPLVLHGAIAPGECATHEPELDQIRRVRVGPGVTQQLCHCGGVEGLLFAISAGSPTAVNIGLVPRVRVALGGVRDVVIIDGDADLAPSATMSSAEVEAYAMKHNSDPRTWADSVIRVAPRRIQAWREENELAGRMIMRNGVWVSSP